MTAWLRNTFVELKLSFRDKQALFWSYLFPLFFLFLFVTIFGRGNTKTISGMMPGVLCISAMAGGFFSLSVGLVVARERGTLRRYRLAPVSARMIITSQLASGFLVALSTMLLQLAVARLVYHIEITGNFGTMMLMLCVGLLTFLSLGFAIASVAESVKVALITANTLFYPLMFLSGAALPKQMLPASLRRVSQFLPATFFVDGLGRIMVDGAGLQASFGNLVVLAITFFTALLIAAGLFRWESRESLPATKKARVIIIVLIFIIAAFWVNP